MTAFTFNYLRVSTQLQKTERQLNNIPCDRTFVDKVSGKNTNRPELNALLNFIEQGDHINVHSIDRLARNLSELKTLIDKILSTGCSLQFHRENLLFTGETNALQDLMLNVIGAVSEFERAMINERRLEGIAKAREKGVMFGRKPNKDLHNHIHRLLNEGYSIRGVADRLHCSPATVQRVKNQKKHALCQDPVESEQEHPVDDECTEAPVNYVPIVRSLSKRGTAKEGEPTGYLVEFEGRRNAEAPTITSYKKHYHPPGNVPAKKKRFTDKQIIGMIQEQENGLTTAQVCRKYGISSALLYQYKANYQYKINDKKRGG